MSITLDNLLLNKNMNRKNYINIVIRKFHFCNCNDYKLMCIRLKITILAQPRNFILEKILIE